MKKIFLFLLCFLPFFSDASQNPTGMRFSALRWLWRVKDLAPERETHYRQLLHEAGVKNADSVLIGSSKRAKEGGVTWGPTLLVDDQQMSNFDAQEQRFLIGRKATHIKNRSMLKFGAGILALMPLCYYAANKVVRAYDNKVERIKNERLKRILSARITRECLGALTTFAVLTVALIPLSWKLELEATREGTKALDCKAGALSWMEKRSAVKDTMSTWETVKHVSQKYFFNRFSHPPISWHIAEVQKLS